MDQLIDILAVNLHDYGYLPDAIKLDNGEVKTLYWNKRMERYQPTAQPYPDAPTYTPDQIFRMADTFLA